jgi:DMSO reductase anchor subunit
VIFYSAGLAQTHALRGASDESMNQEQQELMDEVGLGTLLALAWCLAVLILLFIHPTPTMLIVGSTATSIGLLFAIGVATRWLYLGQRKTPRVKRKGNRINIPR